MIDDASGHKQGRLKAGMAKDMQHCRHRALGRAKTQQKSDQAKMADGGIGKDRFQISFEQRHCRTENHRDKPGCRHDQKPRIGAGQHRPKPCHQKQPRFHHCCRMQIG